MSETPNFCCGALSKPIDGKPKFQGIDTYSDLKQYHKERFNFDVLSKVFEDFLSNVNRDQFMNGHIQDGKYIFTHDKIRYRATVENGQEFRNGETIYTTVIRLPNDGFLYTHPDEMKIFKKPSEVGHRHHSDEWCLLDCTETMSKFSKLIGHSRDFLGSDKIKYNTFYNYEEYGVDFNAFFGDKKLTVCFHYGYPESPFEDYWFDT
jgi:hypothetical protein